MVFETKTVRITELAKETEQYLLQKGCKKSTLGVYKATWHKFMAFSSSDVYSRTAAEDFLKLYFGVDVHSAIQKLDSRMRHALRHMNALEDYLRTCGSHIGRHSPDSPRNGDSDRQRSKK